jgi:glycosyltransferase involved in cell wall biosynthesis
VKLLKHHKRLYFFAAGSGNMAIRERCEEILGQENGKRFIWLGGIKEVEIVYNGLDILVSSSLFGEGFSNTIAEAMACGTPCVVTDVGDSAMIVGDTGGVVRPRNVDALVEGIDTMLEADRQNLGEKARERIVSHFTLRTMIETTQKEIVSCAASRD